MAKLSWDEFKAREIRRMQEIDRRTADLHRVHCEDYDFCICHRRDKQGRIIDRIARVRAEG